MAHLTQYQGTVEKLFPSRFGGGSFSLDGQRGLYFNTKQPLPAFVQPGANVKFSGELGRNGKSVFVEAAGIEQGAAPVAAAGAASVGGSYGETQAKIQYQSARNAAIEVVTLLLTNGALVLPAAASKKAGVIEAAIDRFTAIYFEDTDILGALDRAVVEAPAPKAGKKAAAAAAEADEGDEDEGLPE